MIEFATLLKVLNKPMLIVALNKVKPTHRARESVRAREHRSESGHPLRSQFWKISESVRDKMYVPESGSPLGSQLGDHRNF